MNNLTVLDASALLALIQNEAGANLVSDAITQGKAIISSVNLSEVIGRERHAWTGNCGFSNPTAGRCY